MKAIVLARVSTKEQEEGHSIGAQRQRLADYCARKGLDVIRTFELVESSTRGERKKFSAMLEFVKAQDETIAIVADAVDRFQRSFKESVLIDELIRNEEVELHFYREGMVIGKSATSTDILRWDFSVMGAKSYVLNLSENVRRSLEYKRRNGEWGAFTIGNAGSWSGCYSRITPSAAHRSAAQGEGVGPDQQDPEGRLSFSEPNPAYPHESILLR
jgi:site-specific DNA recombinase